MIYKFFKFGVVGGSGVVVDFSITYALKEWLHLNKYMANSIGFVCAATSNYFLNRVWTFGSTNPNVGMEYTLFLLISMMGLGLNNLIIYLLNDRYQMNFYVSKLLAIGVVTVWNFVMNYLFTFN